MLSAELVARGLAGDLAPTTLFEEDVLLRDAADADRVEPPGCILMIGAWTKSLLRSSWAPFVFNENGRPKTHYSERGLGTEVTTRPPSRHAYPRRGRATAEAAIGIDF